MLEFEMRNKISSHVTSAVSNKSLEQNSIVAAEAQKLKDNYAKLRKANIEQSKQILKLSDSLLKAESQHQKALQDAQEMSKQLKNQQDK